MKDQFVSVDKIFICLLIDEDNCPICIVHSLEPCNKFDKLIINSDDTCVIEEIKQKENKESYNGHVYVLSVLTQKEYPLNMGRVVTWYNNNISKGYRLVDSSTFVDNISKENLTKLKNTLKEYIKDDISQLIAQYDMWLHSIE